MGRGGKLPSREERFLRVHFADLTVLPGANPALRGLHIEHQVKFDSLSQLPKSC